MARSFFKLITGNSPIVGAAIHNGHDIREDIAQHIDLTEPERLREEDPYTDGWANVAENRIKVFRSRFEVDLNRSRDKAVYQKPEDAWGLQVWKDKLPQAVVDRSLFQYDAFYEAVKEMLIKIHDTFGYVIVLDIHSYNFKRNGPNGSEAPSNENPEINIGTGNLKREIWGPVVDGFMKGLGKADFLGRNLDVRENVKFRGGYFSQWVNTLFPYSSCALAIEFKKIFMDEWTGKLNVRKHKALYTALAGTLPSLVKNSKMIFAHA